MPRPKKGDIVIVEQSGDRVMPAGCIIGEVVSYDNEYLILVLSWPKAFFINSYDTLKFTATPEEIVILSAKETWDCLAQLFKNYQSNLDTALRRAIEHTKQDQPLLCTTADIDGTISKSLQKIKNRREKHKKAQ